MSKKKALTIIIIIVLVVLSILFIDKKFSQPYKIVQNLINDSKQNKSITEYLIEKDEYWEQIEENSMYGSERKEIDYPYIKLRGSLSSVSISYGAYLNQTFSFDYGNLDEEMKRISLWYEDFNKGRLLSKKRIGISGLTNREDKIGFAIVNKDGKREFELFTGSCSSTTQIDANTNLFIALNADKVRIKKNEDIILGFIVWDEKDIQSSVYSFDSDESIIDAFPSHKINIIKCKLLDSDFEK